MDQQSGQQRSLELSYLELRKAVGIIGVGLPFVLAFGKMLLQGPGLKESISCYYYTDLGNVFVGSLCAIGVFLMSCRGYDWRDQAAGIVACIFAVGVALFPTTPCVGAPPGNKLIGCLHLAFAALLFLTLAYFCLALFTKTNTDPGKHPTPQKRKRNTVYRACGITILVCIVLIAIVHLPQVKESVEALSPVFWLESLAVIAFGFAWLVKGETILKDQ
jgi:hypothetical protein